MSPEKQRVAIAIACGWTPCQKGCNGKSWRLPDDSGCVENLPDYLNDLNACHEMEKTLRPITAARYHQLIQTRLKSCDLAIGATSSLRCEAFLRVKGTWEEEANTTKSVSPTSAATEDSSTTDKSGNETDFVTKSMTADEIMAGKMAKDRVESDRWYAMFSDPFPTEEDAQ